MSHRPRTDLASAAYFGADCDRVLGKSIDVVRRGSTAKWASRRASLGAERVQLLGPSSASIRIELPIAISMGPRDVAASFESERSARSRNARLEKSNGLGSVFECHIRRGDGNELLPPVGQREHGLSLFEFRLEKFLEIFCEASPTLEASTPREVASAPASSCR